MEDIDLAFIHFVSPGILSEWHILDALMNCNVLMNGIGPKTKRLKERSAVSREYSSIISPFD